MPHRLNMSHPALNGGDLHAHAANSGLNSGQQDPGLHSASQDPGSLSRVPRTGPSRPYFYVHAPPPPPPPHMLQYQWPLPFFYNPFEGFPGVGYGVVMPPFHPSLYMEPPAYMVSHPPVVTGDYMRLLHPHIQAPAYPNPNQSRRVRPAHPVSQTVSSEVQTEPTQRPMDSRPLAGSDTGNGTASSSPSSSSSSQRPNSVEADHVKNQQVRSNFRDLQENGTRHEFNILPPAESKMETLIRAALEEQKSRADDVVQDRVSNCGNTRCNMWSVSSSESPGPVCSSSKQEDEAVKCASAGDVQTSWGSAAPQAAQMKMDAQPQREQLVPPDPQLEQEGPEGALQSKDDVGVKILRLPFSCTELLLESQDDVTELVPCEESLKFCQRKERMNESVWSVESLPLFVPTKEWMLQNNIPEPKVTDVAEEAEPESLSPKPESVLLEKSCSSLEKLATPRNSPTMEKTSPTELLMVQSGMDVEADGGSGGQPCDPTTERKTEDVSPSKCRLVDCGVQCNKLQELRCVCEEVKSSMGPAKKQLFNISEMQKLSADRFANGHVQKKQRRPGPWKSKERHSGQQESHAGYSGKSKGGSARNHRF